MTKVLAGRKILVVEDEFLVLTLTESMLGDLGCEDVAAAGTVCQALAMIEAQSFDAVVLDMNLGGERPYEVADALAERGVPFIFATGYVGHDVQEPYRDRTLLRKPYQRADLADALGPLLAQPADRTPEPADA